MNDIIQLLPKLDPEEMLYIQQLVADLSESELQQFATMYNAQRKDPQMVLILAIIGFPTGINGIHRFFLGNVGMGLLYLFTFGLCYIGTIMDLVNHKKLAFEYNGEQALKILALIRTTV